VKKLKHDNFEKDSTIDSMKIKLEAQAKNNKFLGELCESLKLQLKKNKDKLDEELEEIINQKKEFDKEKNAFDLEKSRGSPLKSMQSSSSINEMKLNFGDIKKEKIEHEKKIEHIKKKYEKELNSQTIVISQKDKKIHECEMKINQMEHDMRKKTEDYDTLQQEYKLCKEKIPDLKSKLDTIHKSKLSFDNDEINNIRESYEFNISKRNKEMKKCENEVNDMSLNIEKMRRIEGLLKDELVKKDNELQNANEVMQIIQNDNDKMMEENFNLKKELASLKIKPSNAEVYKEYEAELNVYKHNVLLLEDEKNTMKKKIEKGQQIKQNKSEQNYAMVDLMKVMKKEIELLQGNVQPNQILTEKYKELKNDENKILLDLHKISEEQLSDSEPEYEGESEDLEN